MSGLENCATNQAMMHAASTSLPIKASTGRSSAVPFRVVCGIRCAASGFGWSVGERRTAFRGQAGDSQLRLLDDALAHLHQLTAALEQVDGSLQVEAAILELGHDLLQLVVDHLEAARFRRICYGIG